jgi:hypothetical protein
MGPPSEAERRVGEGEARLAAGQPGPAAQAFAAALSLDLPPAARSRALYGLAQATVLGSAGPRDYRRALGHLDRLLREHPGSAEAVDARAWRTVLAGYLARTEELERLKRIDVESERRRLPR